MLLPELCKSRTSETHLIYILQYEKCLAVNWKTSSPTLFVAHLMISCILHISLYQWCSAKGLQCILSNSWCGYYVYELMYKYLFSKIHYIFCVVFMHVFIRGGFSDFWMWADYGAVLKKGGKMSLKWVNMLRLKFKFRDVGKNKLYIYNSYIVYSVPNKQVKIF